MKKEINKLIKTADVEARIISVLLSRGYVRIIDKKKSLKYSNISLTKKGRVLIKDDIDISPEFIKKYRFMFPPGKKSTEREVTEKMKDIFREYSENGDSKNLEKLVLEATDRYINNVSDPTFCEKAGNFISRQMPGGSIRSTLREYIELVLEEEKDMDKMEDIYGIKLDK